MRKIFVPVEKGEAMTDREKLIALMVEAESLCAPLTATMERSANMPEKSMVVLHSVPTISLPTA